MDAAEITRILRREGRRGGISRSAADKIFTAAYEELHVLADRQMRREREDHTLQPTALLNELYLRLVDQSRIDWRNRAHFFAIAGRAMRRILVESARRKAAVKRGGSWERVLLTDDVMITEGPTLDPILLERALERLAGKSERMARVVELRVYAGLSGEEIAEALGYSRKTITEDWRVALMWLRADLAGEELP